MHLHSWLNIFNLALTPGFNKLGNDNCNTRQEIFEFRNLVRLIRELTVGELLYIYCGCLTHWGRVTHICHYLNQCWYIVNWTFETNFSEILIEIYTFSFMKIRIKLSSGKCRPFCLGLNVLGKLGRGEVLLLILRNPSEYINHTWSGSLSFAIDGTNIQVGVLVQSFQSCK